MCVFFSFVHDGKKIYYFDVEQRKNGVKMPDGNKIGSYDSHSSITCYYQLDDDGVNKFEYNPFTDKLVLDGKTICEWDEKTIREQLAGIDWQPMAGDVEGAREFIRGLKNIPWLKPDGTVEDGEGVKVFETRKDAEDAVKGPEYEELWDSNRPDVWADARSRAIESGRNYEWKEAWHAAFAAAGAAAFDAAKDTPLFTRRRHAGDAAMDAAYQFVMCQVCGDLQVEEKHREYVRKRFDIWRHGYGVLCEINGVLYVYKKI